MKKTQIINQMNQMMMKMMIQIMMKKKKRKIQKTNLKDHCTINLLNSANKYLLKVSNSINKSFIRFKNLMNLQIHGQKIYSNIAQRTTV